MAATRSIATNLTYEHWRRWIALLVLMLAYLLSVFHRLAVAIMADKLVVDLNLGVVELGVLTAVFFYPYAFMQFPVGILSDRWGTRRLVSVMLLLAALASIVFGLSNNFYLAVVSRFLIGLGVSSAFVPSQRFIASHFPPTAFATLASYFVASGMLGAIGATVPLAYIVNHFGWRSAFLILGIFTGILAIAIWILVPETARRAGKFRSDTDEGQKHENDKHKRPLPWYSVIAKVVLEPKLWPIGIRNFFNYGSNMVLQSVWAGPFLMMIIGLKRETVGYLLMLFPIGQLIMSLFAGYLSGRVFRSRKIPALISGYATVLFWIPFAFFAENLAVIEIGALFLLNGMLSGLHAGPGIAQVKELFPDNLAGSAMGLANLFTVSGPAVLPIIISVILSNHALPGQLVSASSFEIGFRYLLGAAAVAALAMTLSKETLSKQSSVKVRG